MLAKLEVPGVIFQSRCVIPIRLYANIESMCYDHHQNVTYRLLRQEFSFTISRYSRSLILFLCLVKMKSLPLAMPSRNICFIPKISEEIAAKVRNIPTVRFFVRLLRVENRPVRPTNLKTKLRNKPNISAKNITIKQ